MFIKTTPAGNERKSLRNTNLGSFNVFSMSPVLLIAGRNIQNWAFKSLKILYEFELEYAVMKNGPERPIFSFVSH